MENTGRTVSVGTQAPRTRSEAIVTWLIQEWHWVLLGLFYLGGWWVPLTLILRVVDPELPVTTDVNGPVAWMREFWWYWPYSTLASQPYIFPAFWVVLWRRRQELAQLWAQQQRRSRPGHRTRPWGALILTLGCGLLLFSHFVHLALAAFIGLVLILVGVVWQVYGVVMVRALLWPLLFFTLIVPWLPESFLAAIEHAARVVYASAGAGLVRPVLHTVTTQGEMVLVGQTALYFYQPLSGTQGLVAAILFTFWVSLLQRLRPSVVLRRLIVAMGIALGVHLVRVVAALLLLVSNPTLSGHLARLNSWYITLPMLGLILLSWKLEAKLQQTRLGRFWGKVGQAINRLFAPLVSVMDRSERAAGKVSGKVGGGVRALFSPLIWVANQLLWLLEQGGSLFGRSSNRLEQSMQQWERRRRRKKRSQK